MRVAALLALAACASTRAADTTVVVVPDPKPAAKVVVAAPSDDSPCATDADCAFTRVGVGETACCPMLCTPRVVTKKRAKELDDRIAVCSGGRQCPLPQCRPPREQVTPACVQNKCIGKPMPPPADRY
jgi:hypothetical protein